MQKDSHHHLKEIWQQVPPNYYQNGVKKNMLQRYWHTNKLVEVILAIRKRKISPENILDMGCASGWFLSKIAKVFKDSDCYGIDVYKEAVDFGKKKYKKITFRKEDIHNVSYKSNSFDVIICTEVLEHVVDPLQVLKEIKRLLRRNGVAVIEMDTGNFLFRAIWYWWTHLRHGVWEDAHIHAFNAKKLEKLIRKSGLLIQEKKIFNFSMAVVFTATKKS